MRNAEYRSGMGIGLVLELGSGVCVRVMARAQDGVRVRILFCSTIAQFLAILLILH